MAVTFVGRRHGAISGHDRTGGAIDLGRRSLSRGPGRLSRCRRELVRGCCVCSVSGKSLPVLAQWLQAEPPDLAASCGAGQQYYQQRSCTCRQISGARPVWDLRHAGNVREWVANGAGGDLRFILGGSWKSQSYLSPHPKHCRHSIVRRQTDSDVCSTPILCRQRP